MSGSTLPPDSDDSSAGQDPRPARDASGARASGEAPASADETPAARDGQSPRAAPPVSASDAASEPGTGPDAGADADAVASPVAEPARTTDPSAAAPADAAASVPESAPAHHTAADADAPGTALAQAHSDDARHPAACENCATALQGDFCHRCGQSAHNPIHHLGHAIEEVFESFWHLDGRIFRTLRELLSPGRVARNYLAGHRVRYIPPLRLFVVLSLITFFVGKLVLHFDTDAELKTPHAAFAGDATVAEVERHRDRLLGELREAEAEAARTPGVKPALIASRVRIQSEAATRIAELRKHDTPALDAAARADAAAVQAAATADAADAGGGAKGRAAAQPQRATAKTPDAARAPPATGAEAASSAPADARPAGDGGLDEDLEDDCERFASGASNPAWVPAFATRWMASRVVRACRNLEHADTEGGRLFQAFMAAVPSALFVLMPVFALLLKLVYLGSGRSYLAHLVVALYSHAFLLLTLLCMFLLSGSETIGAPTWLRSLGYTALWIWIPIYLWLMQRRIYGGGWLSNFVRYWVIGCIYFVLVGMAATYAALVGLSA